MTQRVKRLSVYQDTLRHLNFCSFFLTFSTGIEYVVCFRNVLITLPTLPLRRNEYSGRLLKAPQVPVDY